MDNELGVGEIVIDLSNLAIDFDGTVTRTNDLVCKLINYRCGTELDYDDVQYTGWWDDSPFNEVFHETHELIDQLGLRLSYEPYDEKTCSIIYDLVNAPSPPTRGTLNVLTCNPEKTGENIAEWFRLRTGVYYNINVNCVGRVSATEKLAYDYDYYVDDSSELARAVQASDNGETLFLMNTNWNENIVEGDGVIRCSSWTELVDALWNHGPVVAGVNTNQRMDG